MAFLGQSELSRVRGMAGSGGALVLALATCALTVACQKEDHPPYAAGCETDCPTPTVISIGSGSGTTTGTPSTDAGFNAGTLTGHVLALGDDTFSRSVPFTQQAIITAAGSSGNPVSTTWDGTNPYTLSGVAVVATNWIKVAPANVQGDALPTYESVQTSLTDTADLAVVDSAVIDGVLTAVSATRAPAFGQVVLFFRNAGTGAALSGIQAVMSASDNPAYAEASGWVAPDDTTVTGSSGLVVFGNVNLPTGGNTTQTVTVSRPATATTAAASGGQFAIPVVEGAVTIASVGVQL